jgi:hypothetical protein
MAKYLATENLSKQTLKACVPWEFVPKPGTEPSLRACKEKEERQIWYHSLETDWQFFTTVEGTNPNQRISNDNPPLWVNGAVADFDLSLSVANDILIQVAKMPFKPSWLEESLGGNFRLHFDFGMPLRTDDRDFTVFIFQQLHKFLKLDLLPGLDRKAWEDPARTYCNGGKWRKLDGGPIPVNRLQAFLVKTAASYNFKNVKEYNIPLDIVEKFLKEKYPNMSWDGAFEVDSQGSTFWVPESTSPKSAIVKKDGMFTFSAHATKNFYSWGDLVGHEKLVEFKDNAMAVATQGIHFDGRLYHWKQNGYWFHGGEKEFHTYLRTDCNLGDGRVKGDNASDIDRAQRFVQSKQRIHVAASLVFHPPGIYDINGSRVLNVFENKAIVPVTQPQIWGPDGNFPFLSLYFDTFFAAPKELQKLHYLAWLQLRYHSALFNKPSRGQVVGIGGPGGCGKNFNDRGIVGGLLGSFTDASNYLMSRTQWNHDLFSTGLWVVDDETALFTQEMREAFQNFLKKFVANSDFRIQRRFCDEIMSKWYGYIMFTFNLDAASVRIIPRLDNTSADKISLYEAGERVVEFGGEENSKAILRRELPFFGRYILDMKFPDWFVNEWMNDDRFVLRAYHQPSLLAHAYASSPESTLKELLTELLVRHFDTGGEATYSLSAVNIVRQLTMDRTNDCVMRGMTPNNIDRYMANIHREGIMPCQVSTSEQRTNVWTFKREDFQRKPKAV